MCSSTQPPRVHHDGTAYSCTSRRLGEHQMSTMSAKKREHNCAGPVDVDKVGPIIAKCFAGVKMPLAGPFS
eukprot:7834194-Pyramimonas_sp.AAC.1